MLAKWADLAFVLGVLLLAPLFASGHVITAANASKVLLRQEVSYVVFGLAYGAGSVICTTVAVTAICASLQCIALCQQQWPAVTNWDDESIKHTSNLIW